MCTRDVNNTSKNLTATGTVKATSALLRRVILTGGSDAASVVIRNGGSGGTIILTVKAAANTTVPVEVTIRCATDLHATLSGTSPSVYLEYE